MPGANYNDPEYDYTQYWNNRLYENESEIIALKKFLKDNRGKKIIDVGGGFGRLAKFYSNYFQDITIFDYSQKILDQAKEQFKKDDVKAKTAQGDIYNLTNSLSEKYDTVVSIRVSHHLDDLNKAVSQISQILNQNGVFIFEFANKIHAKSAVSNLFKGNLKYFNQSSVSIAHNDVTFLNHHPKYVFNILKKNGFVIDDILSVSNFRFPFLKRVMPVKLLLIFENILQKPLSYVFFGPSIFVKSHKESHKN